MAAFAAVVAEPSEFSDVLRLRPIAFIFVTYSVLVSGAVEDAELFLAVGYRVANADKLPEWKPGNEFKAKRDAMLKK